MRNAVSMLIGLGAVLLVAACQPTHDELVADNERAIKQFCLDCHNYAEQAGNLALEPLDLDKVAAEPAKWERVVRKLRAGMMPPVDEPRPDHGTYLTLANFIELELDSAPDAGLAPPGLHRLNRVEYGNAIRDLLALEVDPTALLPADDSSRGFDNQAGTLSLSPALLEAYLSAASKISRLALGRQKAPSQTVYRLAGDTTQNYHVEGLPFGTRGGLVAEHVFPVDAAYVIKIYSVNLGNMGNFSPFGEVRGEQLEVLIDGERVALVDWDDAFDIGRGFGGGNGQLKTIDVRVPVKAGPHQVGVTFLATNYAPSLDMNHAFERSTIETGGLPGFSFYPHIGSVRVDGPYDSSGVSETPSRQRVLVCQPQTSAEEEPCARRILETLARRAYRGLQAPSDIETLLGFYREGRSAGDFEAGVELALVRLLADPKFIYRSEQEPQQVAPGEVYAVSDLELASRLSFFIWSSIPDDELLASAELGKLSEPHSLEAEVRRMLADSRSVSLAENFAGQWFSLRGLDAQVPVVSLYPDFDDNLRQAFRRETELLFDAIVRENRPIPELLSADYTFVNERLAKHYGIPGVYGSRFRRVNLTGELEIRRGLLGHGSVLSISSQPVRTSPVMRGKWVMQNILGSPAPDPPPNVPELEPPPSDAAGNAHVPSIREQMESHRRNPPCSTCHRLMDPIGFALEQYDAIGRWRTTDGNTEIDAEATLYDGTHLTGVAGLREFLLGYSDQFVSTAAEKLLTYALGRGVEYYDMPVVRRMVREARADEYRFHSLVLALVRSPPFRMSRKGGRASGSEPGTTTAALSDPR